jgi:hypothetical protein
MEVTESECFKSIPFRIYQVIILKLNYNFSFIIYLEIE